MSKRQIASLSCPQCHNESRFEIWDSVNVTFHPEFKEKVLSGELFQFTCQNCNYTAPVDYTFLYHDMAKKVMLHYVGREKSTDDEIVGFKNLLANMKEKDIETYDRLMGTQHRFIKGRSDLIEKIQIFSAGYDDRVIELMKETIKQAKGDQLKDFKAFIFGDDINRDHYFFIVYDADNVDSLPFDQKEYEQLKEIYRPLFSQEDYVVNTDWARVRVKLRE